MKTLVRNQLGEKSVNMYLPMNATNAQSLCEALFEGTWAVYELDLSGGVDNDVTAYDAEIQVRNAGTGQKRYFRGIFKATVTPDDIQTAFTGLTIDGVLVDEVVIISFAPMTFA